MWWIILGALSVTAIIVIAAQREYIRWPEVAWYQIIAGFLLTIFGGMISGWSIATFIASSKGNAPRAASYEIRPKAPPVEPPKASPSEDGSPIAPPPRGETFQSAYDSLDQISGIGPKRARAAAEAGFRTLRDVLAASPDRLEELRNAINSSLTFKSVLMQAKNAASSGEKS
ncbi:MAG TPA: helix-hairpin-helix domain-containing protein [Steroidobacteraceae bacterium]|nr:helix-hairpin-helix domain-containing protein [Steroidobacteraceae bacterium]